jgi:glutamine synthetase
MDVHYLVGFETEFVLLQKTDDNSIKAVSEHHYSASRAIVTGSPAAACIENIVTALEQCGITVEMYHAEAASGQVRFSIIVLGIMPVFTSYSMRSSRHHSPLWRRRMH